MARPSYGRAYISGVEITDDNLRSTSRMRMGLCPQHDILYEDLTVEEHLLFYSRYEGGEEAGGGRKEREEGGGTRGEGGGKNKQEGET
jgi:ABC-type multidrug transport system ATPase subunit